MSITEKLSSLLEAGQKAKPAGHMDITKITVDDAVKYTNQKGFDYKKYMPEFENNFSVAKKEAEKGWLFRKDMPVITSKDVQAFKEKLEADGIKVSLAKVKVSDLSPIQKQIYFDTVLNDIMSYGVEASLHHVTNKAFIVSNDMHIIDGHHRFLSAILIDPDMPVSILKIDLPITELLAVAHAFSKELGNDRNE